MVPLKKQSIMLLLALLLVASETNSKEPQSKASTNDYSVGLKMRQTMNSLSTGSHEASRQLSSKQVERVLNDSKGDSKKYRKNLQRELRKRKVSNEGAERE